MKRSSILINTSRGTVVNESALLKAIQGRWIAGAGLDVFEGEPQLNPALMQMGNLVLTPHIASSSEDTRREMCLIAARNIRSALEGYSPESLVNGYVWDSPSRRC